MAAELANIEICEISLVPELSDIKAGTLALARKV
jgi:hypothetical protein